MMEPGVALGAAAQVAVSLVGYTGVVVVFGRGAIHEWPPVDKFRLRLMLMFSVLPLVLSLFGLLVLAAGVTPEAAWRWCSGLAGALLLGGGVHGIAGLLAFRPRQIEAAGASRLIFLAVAIAGSAICLLQAYNIWVLDAFWPFFAAIIMAMLSAIVQFVRLILGRQTQSPPAP